MDLLTVWDVTHSVFAFLDGKDNAVTSLTVHAIILTIETVQEMVFVEQQ